MKSLIVAIIPTLLASSAFADTRLLKCTGENAVNKGTRNKGANITNIILYIDKCSPFPGPFCQSEYGANGNFTIDNDFEPIATSIDINTDEYIVAEPEFKDKIGDEASSERITINKKNLTGTMEIIYWDSIYGVFTSLNEPIIMV